MAFYSYQTSKGSVHHFDLYRLKDSSELENIGFFDCLKDGICLIEWPELVLDFLDQPYLNLRIEHYDNMRHYELIAIN